MLAGELLAAAAAAESEKRLSEEGSELERKQVMKHREHVATEAVQLLKSRWREPDSNHRSRSCERLFWALPIGDGGTKGCATYRFRSETAMLAWSGGPQPFPSRRDREFESVFLQQRVCKLSVPLGL